MKLLNILSVATLGVLFAVGCSSVTTTTSDAGDGGTTGETGGDTGTTPTDTGTTPTDTGTPETGATCEACIESAAGAGGACNSEASACQASTACQAVIKCINDCPESDTACQNACFSDGSDPGVVLFTDYFGCLQTTCAAACGS